ncbi:NAD-dependent epimerase/dehydratase family protein [Lacrimispora defluvii]|uniref:NAD(P)-dependent oxidoreductase n=1 Tax=Lacrimispora defluvii TaxID=2719233 RepID=A0ABX1W274_9FIRM|nr:NAD(P)-dependent oxidoreductase [Lacrimispora defluvii]NNJ32821.1 NAD(P)-dependent oxidoreductase [Lacrimispora defluvii]
MQRVVITGADGFIGSHFTRKCIEEGVEVWAVVHPKYGRKEKIENLPGVHIVVSDIQGMFSKIDKFPRSVDAFYHFSWKGINANDRDDFDCQMENMGMNLDAVRFAAYLRPRVFIVPGSTNEYLYYGKPINENAIPSPPNAYGSVKIAIRYLSQLYARKFGMGFVYVVIAGIYASDRKDNNVIYYTIERLLRGEKPALTKLEQLWDYVHIDDVVEALYLLGNKGKNDVFYTVGRGDNQPLYKYIETIRNLINPDLPLGIGDVPYMSDKLPCSCVDLTAIKRDTGFQPKVDFEDGIKGVIEMLRQEMMNEK